MKQIFQSTDAIPPGKYVRRWEGHETVMDVFFRGTILCERSPMGVFGEPRDNPGATYESAEVSA